MVEKEIHQLSANKQNSNNTLTAEKNGSSTKTKHQRDSSNEFCINFI